MVTYKPKSNLTRKQFEDRLNGAWVVKAETDGWDEYDATEIKLHLETGEVLTLRQWGIYCDDSGIAFELEDNADAH